MTLLVIVTLYLHYQFLAEKIQMLQFEDRQTDTHTHVECTNY